MSLIKAILNEDDIGVKQLLEQKIDIKEVDEEGTSAFILAIKYGISLDNIKRFIDLGTDPFETSQEGVGAIDIAIEAQRLDVVKHLHQLGLDLNTTKRDSKMTPLMVAACYNRVEIAQYLILNDVDENKTDINGLRAIDYARKLGQNAIFEFLQKL